MKILQRTLTATDASNLYQNMLCDNTGLKIYYKFEAGELSTLIDYSGGNRHAIAMSTSLPTTTGTTHTTVPYIETGYSCHCTGTGFTGTNCTVNIDDCTTSPCLNGGTCVDGINSYQCSCATGYTGTNCHVPSGICYGINTAARTGYSTGTGNIVFTRETSLPAGRYGSYTHLLSHIFLHICLYTIILIYC
jgi:hypothetical protein